MAKLHKKIIRILVFCFLSIINFAASACDACGGNMGNLFIGSMTLQGQQSIGFRYRYFSFRSPAVPNDPYAALFQNKQILRRIEFLGQLMLNKHWSLSGILPYMVSENYFGKIKTSTSGISDPAIFIRRVLYTSPVSNPPCLFTHSLNASIGLKLPLGAWESHNLLDITPGSGSWDFIAGIDYLLAIKNSGIRIDGLVKFNNANSHGEKIGNGINSNTLIYHKINTSIIDITPSAGFFIEAQMKSRVNDYEIAGTQGMRIYGNYGLQVTRKKLAANFSTMIPFREYGDKTFRNAGMQFLCQFNYSF
jgi:hypothetical protein